MVCLQPAPVNLLAFAQTSRIHQVGTAISHSALLLQNSMFCNHCEPNGSLGCVQWCVNKEMKKLLFFYLHKKREAVRLFHIHTKLVIRALMPTLYSNIFAVFFIICVLRLSKCKTRSQLVKWILNGNIATLMLWGDREKLYCIQFLCLM